MNRTQLALLLIGVVFCAHLANSRLYAAEDSFSSAPARFDDLLVTSNTGQSLSNLIQAQPFYTNGYTGTSAIVANIEAGHIWNGHQTLTHVTTLVQDTVSPGTQTGDFDRHATAVGQTIGGRLASPSPGTHQLGIAHSAELWSGSIAHHWVGAPYSGSFDITSDTFLNVYKQILITGVGPMLHTADVTNSSFGDPSDTTGAAYEWGSRGVDAINRIAHKTVVFAAGNSGPGGNSVGSPASGFNVISVGALDSDTAAPPYAHVANFSSRSPTSVFVPYVQNVTNISDPLQGMVIASARARVDIVAPGTNLTLAFYGGQTGGNSPLLGTPIGYPTGSALYSTNNAGTSFAAPIVAGAATLMADAARQVYGGGTNALDGRVSKAILMTGADKNITAGWSNGQAPVSGVITTTQSLDYTSGAGRLNMTGAYGVLLAGTADVPGLGGGTVRGIGWDYGQVAPGSPNDYYLNGNYLAGTKMDVTLDWFVNRGINLATNATTEQSFQDLDLEVWRSVAGVPTTLVAHSISQYNNAEHLYFDLPTTGEYMLRVLWAGENWNLVADSQTTQFGLAWSVPEPGSIVPALFGGLGLLLYFLSRKTKFVGQVHRT